MHRTICSFFVSEGSKASIQLTAQMSKHVHHQSDCGGLWALPPLLFGYE